ncbi:hypothetical protein MYF60_26775, partial [Klebsiella pneumoniae]|nr:hypothetical protein [Klebsiella pneumoniae]
MGIWDTDNLTVMHARLARRWSLCTTSRVAAAVAEVDSTSLTEMEKAGIAGFFFATRLGLLASEHNRTRDITAGLTRNGVADGQI